MDDDSEDTATEDVNVDDGGKAEEEYDDLQLSSSPDAETTILFTKPLGSASGNRRILYSLKCDYRMITNVFLVFFF